MAAAAAAKEIATVPATSLAAKQARAVASIQEAWECRVAAEMTRAMVDNPATLEMIPATVVAREIATVLAISLAAKQARAAASIQEAWECHVAAEMTRAMAGNLATVGMIPATAAAAKEIATVPAINLVVRQRRAVVVTQAQWESRWEETTRVMVDNLAGWMETSLGCADGRAEVAFYIAKILW